MNIVIPMAGVGSRFSEAGYQDPKPLIPVHSRPMIQFVIENLCPVRPHQFIFLVLEDHLRRFNLETYLSKWAPGSIIVPVNQVTEGAACTVLLAKEHINNQEPLMIANCDQWIGISIDDYLKAFDSEDLDGFVMTMKANDPKWSFIRLNSQGTIAEIVEKKVISDEATVGIYNFRTGSMFVEGAEEMISLNLRANDEFYVAPVYNQVIAKGARIGHYNIGTLWDGMYGLGTPKDLDHFLSLNVGKS